MKRNGIENLLREFVKQNDWTLRALVCVLVPLLFWKFLMPESYYASPKVLLGEFTLYFLIPAAVITMVYDYINQKK